MEAKQIINQIDLAFTQDYKLSIQVREIKKRGVNNSYYLVEQGNQFCRCKVNRFSSAKKALEYFYKLCIEMNLVSYNHSL